MEMFHTTVNLYIYGFEGEVPGVKNQRNYIFRWKIFEPQNKKLKIKIFIPVDFFHL